MKKLLSERSGGMNFFSPLNEVSVWMIFKKIIICNYIRISKFSYHININ